MASGGQHLVGESAVGYPEFMPLPLLEARFMRAAISSLRAVSVCTKSPSGTEVVGLNSAAALTTSYWQSRCAMVASTTAGGNGANCVATWNGSTWSALGSGLGYYPASLGVPQAFALATGGSSVYVGGYFTSAGGISARSIAKWDGSAWSALGSGIIGYGCVRAVAVTGQNVFAGGSFTNVGGVSANHIARWDGERWAALGSGVLGPGDVYAIGVNGTHVYVGGSFTNAGGVSANGIAEWNGTDWFGLGSGVNNTVTAISLTGSDVYLGGYFTRAGGKPSYHFARWSTLAPPPTPPHITNVQRKGAGCAISFTTQTGQAYSVFYKDELSNALWSILTDNVSGTGDILTVNDPGSVGSPRRFYRVGTRQ
jgi:beta-propeller uncharacterized protein DUF5122